MPAPAAARPRGRLRRRAGTRPAARAEAARRLDPADPVVVVGSGPDTRDHGADPAGTPRPYDVEVTVGDGGFTGALLADEAPYGVGHLVASRLRR